MKPRWTSIVAVIGGLGLAVTAHAELYEFFRITSNASDNIAPQLFVDVTDASTPDANQVSFVFTNVGSISESASITRVYFDDGVLLGIAEIYSSLGVVFSQDGNPGDLPGGNNIYPPFETTDGFLAEADSPPYHNGINYPPPDEWLEIVFDLNDSGAFADVIRDLNDGTIRIGLHVQAIDGNDESDSFVNVPAPGAALLGFLGLSVVGWLRRRLP